MFALIETASGRLLNWDPSPMTAGVGQSVIDVPDDTFATVSSETHRWNAAAVAFRLATQEEIDALATLLKDRQADALFGADGELTPAVTKKGFVSLAKVTHDALQALESAANLPATTVPGFAAFVQAFKADFRSRL